MEERLTRLNKATRGLVPRDTQLYAAAMEPLAYRAAKDLVAAASIRLGQAYDQAWYDVGMQHKHVASMFISARFMGPGKTPEPASPSSAAEAREGLPLKSSAQILDPGMQTRTLSEGQSTGGGSFFATGGTLAGACVSELCGRGRGRAWCQRAAHAGLMCLSFTLALRFVGSMEVGREVVGFFLNFR